MTPVQAVVFVSANVLQNVLRVRKRDKNKTIKNICLQMFACYGKIMVRKLLRSADHDFFYSGRIGGSVGRYGRC